MGISSSVYLGPYLECKTHEVEVDATMRSCTKDTCSQYEKEVYSKDKKFCPQCGSPIDKVTYKVKEKNVQQHYLREEIDEDLHNIREDTLFSNRSRDEGIDTWIANKGFCDRRCHLDDSCVTEITQDRIAEEISLFCTTFEKALTIFNDKYGKGNVAVKWGLVYYWS